MVWAKRQKSNDNNYRENGISRRVEARAGQRGKHAGGSVAGCHSRSCRLQKAMKRERELGRRAIVFVIIKNAIRNCKLENGGERQRAAQRALFMASSLIFIWMKLTAVADARFRTHTLYKIYVYKYIHITIQGTIRTALHPQLQPNMSEDAFYRLIYCLTLQRSNNLSSNISKN